MAILKLYGHPQATCTRRVATTLHELKVPFELVVVDVANGAHKTAAYLEKQPFGQIPYIDDDGFILYETRAICRYIAAKHPASGLIPSEPKAHGRFEQAASAELTNFDPSAGRLAVETVMKAKFQGGPADPAVVEKELAALEKSLDGYDRILAKQRYVAGDTLTLADLFHLPYAPYVALGGSDLMTRKPNVARWYKELVARPSWLAYQDGVKTTTSY